MGQPERQEFEYIRHGTQSLIAHWQVATGTVLAPSIADTRTEVDFAAHLAQTVETNPEAGWIFIVDPLNTHQSETLVRWVLVRDPSGKFAPQGFLCTTLAVTPEQIIVWFRQRWQLEVTFEEVRAHLGVETQRQWSDKAIARTTPTLFGLFSMVVLFAHQLLPQEQWHLRQSAWYVKAHPTFIDSLALVRSYLWAFRLFERSGAECDLIKVPSQVFSCRTYAKDILREGRLSC